MSEDTTTAAASAQQQEWEQWEAQIRERALFQTVVIIEDVQFLLDQLQAEREHNRKLREALEQIKAELESRMVLQDEDVSTQRIAIHEISTQALLAASGGQQQRKGSNGEGSE